MDQTRELSGVAGLVALGPAPLQQVMAAAVATLDPLAREIPITLEGKAATLSDLKPGMPVAVKLFKDRRLLEDGVTAIEAGASVEQARPAGSEVVGKVKAVDPAEKLLTVTVEAGSQTADRVFDLAQGAVYGVDFKTIEALAFSPERQAEWTGRTVQVVGQFAPQQGTDRVFTLARFRIQCCGADAVQLSIPMVLMRGGVGDIQGSPRQNDWVRVTGRVEFREQPGRAGKITVLRISRPANIVKWRPEPDPYIR
jgi:hypothetical protein